MAMKLILTLMNKKHELKKLGKKIATLRKRAGISQDNLALEAEIGRRTINRLEVGDTDPQFTTLKKISLTLKVKMSELFED